MVLRDIEESRYQGSRSRSNSRAISRDRGSYWQGFQ